MHGRPLGWFMGPSGAKQILKVLGPLGMNCGPLLAFTHQIFMHFSVVNGFVGLFQRHHLVQDNGQAVYIGLDVVSPTHCHFGGHVPTGTHPDM
jgi:hypothetical protein